MFLSVKMLKTDTLGIHATRPIRIAITNSPKTLHHHLILGQETLITDEDWICHQHFGINVLYFALYQSMDV